MPKDYVLTVMARDRVGIVAGIAAAIAGLGGNIDAMSQTVMRGYFTIIVTVQFDEGISAERLAAAVKEQGARGELEVSVTERVPAAQEPCAEGAERFILTIAGMDRSGIMHRVTSYLASRNVNIEDLYAYCEGRRFLFIAQLAVPRGLEVERLQMDLGSLWPEGEMKVSLQHENVFLATNEVEFRHKVS